MPRLYRHIISLGVQFEVVAYPWFLSLFTSTLPLEPMLRAWDCFFHEGIKALQRVALGILWLRQEEILQLHDDLEVRAYSLAFELEFFNNVLLPIPLTIRHPPKDF